MPLEDAPNGLDVGASIRFATFAGVVIVLDLDSEAYFAFDEVTSAFWNALLDHAGDRVAAAAHFGTRGHEFDAFVDECVRRNFLIAAVPQAQVPTLARAVRSTRVTHATGTSVLTCHAWCHLASTWASLRIRGFRRTYLASAPVVCNDDSTRMFVDKAVRAFVRAENLFWFREAPTDCLPRSLALFRFLTGLGIPAVHIIGGTRFPGMVLHAWVEFDGHALLDDQDLIAGFAVLARMP